MPKRLLLAAALLAVGCSHSPPADPATLTGDPNAFVSTCVERNVCVLYQPRLHVQPRGNVTVIEQSRGIVLIDTGGTPAAADAVIAFVRARTSKPVTDIVITHWHGDHLLGAERLLSVWPQARIIASAPTNTMVTGSAADRFMPGDNAEANARLRSNIEGGVAYLRAEGQNQALSTAEREAFASSADELQRYGDDILTARRVAPSIVFDRAMTLPDARVPIELGVWGRGNTEGDVVAWLPRERIVVAGDLLVAPIPFGFNTYPGDWIEVLERMSALAPAVIVPGHGAPMTDRRYLDTIRSALVDVRQQAASLASDESVTLANVAQRMNFDELERTIAGDDPWLKRWFRNYWAGPIASSALREARGEAIVQGAS